MVFVKYEYGSYKKEIVQLLREKSSVDAKLRYHGVKTLGLEEERGRLEERINQFLRMARASNGRATNDTRNKSC